MRAWGMELVRRGTSLWSSRQILSFGLGLSVGVAAVAICSQIIAAYGIPFGLRLGFGLATLLGVGWGAHLAKGTHRPSLAGPLASLAALLVVWPAWIGLQLEVLQAVPTSWWAHALCSELCGVLLGCLNWTIPVALGTQLLVFATRCPIADPRSTVDHADSRQGVWLAALGLSTGLVLMGLVLMPVWGPLWPTLCVLVAVAACVATTGSDRVLPAFNPQAVAASPPLWQMALWAVIGSQFQTGYALISEVTVATGPLLTTLTGVLLLAWCVGWGGFATRRQPLSFTGALVALLWITVAQLAWSGQMIDVQLWLSSRLTDPRLLEVGRIAAFAVLLAPLACWCGATSSPRGVTTSLTLSLLTGFLCGELCQPNWADPLSRLWVLAAIWAVLSLAGLWQTGTACSPWSQRSRMGAVLSLGLLLAITPLQWPTGRAVKLLFSTPALVGARSGWQTHLLPYLDDSKFVATADGLEGRWTLWRMHGADLQVRRQGVPRGAITVRPDWSPQYAPEVVSTLWPMILVDQPARVLVLGAGSSAAIQSALAFPLAELVCCEADDALVGLIQQEISRVGGFDPFADHRCRRIRQPASWLALPAEEQFDVIVSSPASAVLPEGAAEGTVEFYRRAARHLTAQGVFCQRFSSIDFGPRPLLSAALSLQQAFAETACLEVGPGEFLLLGAHEASALVRPDLVRRLEMPHVVHVLSRCNWDWSLPLNLPAYDRQALAEAAAEVAAAPQTIANAWLPSFTPRELTRWAPKLQETANLLLKRRESAPVFPLPSKEDAPRALVQGQSRKSRYLAWMRTHADNPELLRRLTETTAQQQLVQQFPDSHWWEYRKELRTQLQDHPRTGIQMVSHSTSGSSKTWHPEDRRRKEYFEALGAALKAERPSTEQLAAIEQLLEPYDPLLTLFAHQELADLYARERVHLQQEAAHRLHVIYYAPPGDASVRNVIAAIDLLVEHPEAAASPADRFEQLNGLLQILRTRWEARNMRPAKSGRVTQQEVERSLLSVERGLAVMKTLALEAGWSQEDWLNREQVLDRILVRPFRSYRDVLVAHNRESEQKTRELLHRATNGDAEPVQH